MVSKHAQNYCLNMQPNIDITLYNTMQLEIDTDITTQLTYLLGNADVLADKSFLRPCSSLPFFSKYRYLFNAGPDAVVPATQLICTDITGAVKIRDSDGFSVPHISVATSLQQSAQKYKDHPAFRYRANLQQQWSSVSYE